MIPVEDANLIC